MKSIWTMIIIGIAGFCIGLGHPEYSTAIVTMGAFMWFMVGPSSND